MIKSKFVLGLLFLFFLVFSGMVLVSADNKWVYIRPDGTVEGTDKIEVNENVYTFTSDILFDDLESVDMLVEKDNIVIDGAGFSFQGLEGGAGILLMNQNNVTIKNLFGSIFFSNCTNCIVNKIQGKILVENSFNVCISESKIIYWNQTGLKIVYSHNNTIHKNYVGHNQEGICLISSENNTITENTIANNTECGLGVWGSNQNIIIKNNFVNNTKHTADFEFVQNVWDNDSQGNYWDTYNGTDADSNGIGDNPFTVPTSLKNDPPVNIDNYPLMNPIDVEPVTIPEFPSWSIFPIFSVSILVIISLKRNFQSNR